MGVYEDMANDAGYPYGTPENSQMADYAQQMQMEQMRERQEELEMEDQMVQEQMLDSINTLQKENTALKAKLGLVEAVWNNGPALDDVDEEKFISEINAILATEPKEK